MNLHALGRGLGKKLLRDLRAFGVEEAVPDLHAFEHLFESEGHAAADDDLVGLVEEVVDERDFVRDFRPTEDGEQRARGVVEHRGKGFEFLLHEKARGLHRQV